MPNHYTNKVIINGSTVVDLTADTVTAETLADGSTAHLASGAQVTGTMLGSNSWLDTNVTIDATRQYGGNTYAWTSVQGNRSTAAVVGDVVAIDINNSGTPCVHAITAADVTSGEKNLSFTIGKFLVNVWPVKSTWYRFYIYDTTSSVATDEKIRFTVEKLPVTSGDGVSY
jgi:hypothetical protein